MRTYRCPKCGHGTRVDAKRWQVEHGVFCDYCNCYIINPTARMIVLAGIVAIVSMFGLIAFYWLGSPS